MTRSENCVGKELLRSTTEQIPCVSTEQGLQANGYLLSAFPKDLGPNVENPVGKLWEKVLRVSLETADLFINIPDYSIREISSHIVNII